MWRRWDDRLYDGLVAFWARTLVVRASLIIFWRVLFPARVPELQPAPRVLVTVGAPSHEGEPGGEVLVPPEPPPTSRWAARPSHSKAWLACVLLGELQAGVMLRAMWEVSVRS